MTRDNPGFEYAHGWNRFNMRVIGAWPDNDENFIIKNRSLVYAVAIFTVIWLPMTASLAYLRNDMTELIGCLVINIPVAMSIYKIVLLRLRRSALEVILFAMAKDWSIVRTDEEIDTMIEKAKYTRIIAYMSVSLASAVMIAFSTVGAWTAPIQRQFITNETKVGVGFLYCAYFPYDTTETPLFVSTWLSQFFVTIVSMVGYSGPDSIMAMMVLHLCGQLATVRIALTHIVDEESIEDPDTYWERLGSIIERHEELNRHGFVTFTTLIEGLTGDEDFPFLQMIFLVVHLFYTILHLFVYCWTGDLLTCESTALSYAPYESDWVRLSPAQAKALMMVTHRSRIPLQITAGKFVGFSLELFTSIIKTSMGYLSVLLAVEN